MNNKNAAEIKPGQIIIMLTLFSVLNCVLYISPGLPLAEMLLYLALAAAAAAVLMIPFVAVTLKKKSGIIEAIDCRWHGAAVLAALLYAIYLAAAAGKYIAEFSDLAYTRYYPEGSPYICIILLAAVCLYSAYSGEAAVLRAGTPLIVYAAVLTFLLAAAAFGDITSRQPSASAQELADGEFSLLGMGIVSGAVALCVVPGLQKTPKKLCASVYGSIAAMLAAGIVLTLTACAVLGGARGVSSYPLFDAVIYGLRSLSVRIDGAYFVLWTVIAAAVAAFLVSAAASALRAVFPKLKYAAVISAAAAAGAAFLSELIDLGDIGVLNLATPFVLIFAIPLITLIQAAPQK